VTRGDLDVNVHLAGDLQTDKSVTLVPPAAGIPLRLIRIVETGAVVRAGDVVMEFDPADQQYALEQSRSQLQEAEQEILRMRADQVVRAAGTETEILTARFNLRRAEMDAAVPANLVGTSEARVRVLAVEEARRRLAELEGLGASRQTVDKAALATMEQRRNTSRIAALRAEQVISQLEVRAPIDGSVVVRENRDTTNMFYSGMTIPEYRVGDTVMPGRIVLEIIDTARVLIRARVTEQDRPNVSTGQAARVQADVLGGEWVDATVESVSGLASRSFESVAAVRRFELTLRPKEPKRLHPGTTVRIAIAGPKLTGVLHLPRQAVFERDGKTVVFARETDQFVARPVTIVGRTEGRVAVTGVAEGTEVALLDPTTTKEKAAATGEAL
jgi:HlyD family secretion protein